MTLREGSQAHCGCNPFINRASIAIFIRAVLIGICHLPQEKYHGNIPGELLAGKENKKLNSGEQFLAGFGAGVLEAIFAVTPIETVKTKAIQTNSPFMQGVRTILKTEGAAGLYQGVWATIAKQGSNRHRNRMDVQKWAAHRKACADLKKGV